ncbi:hypothetical protein NEDG_00160 [Nematocida displodere]|uniref:Uncharacterized protein n=1 Tax=Nematocida displodere TaxID=1805483 RepID=A0A177EI85_9MICR|nr:hypothetical protein NEDG_00160 [Nematocida displodere]
MRLGRCAVILSIPLAAALSETVLFCGRPDGSISNVVPELFSKLQTTPRIILHRPGELHGGPRSSLSSESFGMDNVIFSEPLTAFHTFALYGSAVSLAPENIVLLSVNTVPHAQSGLYSLLFPACSLAEDTICGFLERCKEGSLAESCTPKSKRDGSIYECDYVSNNAFRRNLGQDPITGYIQAKSKLVYSKEKKASVIETVSLTPRSVAPLPSSLPRLDIDIPISAKSDISKLSIMKVQRLLESYFPNSNTLFHVESSDARGFVVFAILYKLLQHLNAREQKAVEIVQAVRERFMAYVQEDGISMVVDKDIEAVLSVFLRKRSHKLSREESEELSYYEKKLNSSKVEPLVVISDIAYEHNYTYHNQPRSINGSRKPFYSSKQDNRWGSDRGGSDRGNGGGRGRDSGKDRGKGWDRDRDWDSGRDGGRDRDRDWDSGRDGGRDWGNGRGRDRDRDTKPDPRPMGDSSDYSSSHDRYTPRTPTRPDDYNPTKNSSAPTFGRGRPEDAYAPERRNNR